MRCKLLKFPWRLRVCPTQCRAIDGQTSPWSTRRRERRMAHAAGHTRTSEVSKRSGTATIGGFSYLEGGRRDEREAEQD